MIQTDSAYLRLQTEVKRASGPLLRRAKSAGATYLAVATRGRTYIG
ncbi:hypothetical protein [Halorussus caseinilyticus]